MSLRILVNQNDEVAVDNLDGGYNPNYVETINGTIGNPWGGKNFSELRTAVASNNATIYMNASFTFNNTTIEFQLSFVPGPLPLFSEAKGASASGVFAARLNYSANGSLTRAVAGELNTATDPPIVTIAQQDVSTPCVLTIIHHHLPT